MLCVHCLPHTYILPLPSSPVLRPLDFSFLTPRCRSSQARGIVRAVELYDNTPTAKPSKACHGGEARDEGAQTSPRERKLHKVIKARITQVCVSRCHSLHVHTLHNKRKPVMTAAWCVVCSLSYHSSAPAA